MDFESVFKRISDGEDIPEFEKYLITTHFKLQKFRKNEILIESSQDCDQLYFVVKGALRVFYFNIHGEEVTRVFIFENEFCTNLISFSEQATNHENIQCLEDSLVFSINRSDFNNMLAQSHILTKFYSKILEYFINRHLQHFQFMNTLNERQRVEQFLQSSHDINTRVKDKIISTYIGVTPEFFSRVKTNFYKNRN